MLPLHSCIGAVERIRGEVLPDERRISSRVASSTLFTIRIAGRTTYAWDPDNRLRQLLLPGGERQTMSYRSDGLRTALQDEEGDKRMVWDSQGSSGYQDLLEERTP